MTNDHPNFDPTLAPEDAAALDALLEHGRTGAQNAATSDRSARVAAWLKTLDASPTPEPAGDLVDRTLARLQSERMKLKVKPAEMAAAIPAKPARRALRFKHLTDFAAMSVAASLLGIVVTLGVFQARQSANRVACASNLQNVSTAFATFAADHRGNLPALATVDANWLTPNPAVPGSHTNAENLMPLVSAKLLHPANFLCNGRDISSYKSAGTGVAGMPDAARGYSYVNMFATDHPAWDGNHANIVLADRNPLFTTLRPPSTLNPTPPTTPATATTSSAPTAPSLGKPPPTSGPPTTTSGPSAPAPNTKPATPAPKPPPPKKTSSSPPELPTPPQVSNIAPSPRLPPGAVTRAFSSVG